MGYFMLCDKCGFTLRGKKGKAQCPKCGAPLRYTYDSTATLTVAEICDSHYNSLWKYHTLMPISNLKDIVSLGEGNTPLTEAFNLKKKIGFEGKLYLKDETQNPTGTYKDRPATLGISKAVECGNHLVIIASDGNAGPAVAAYAARAGLSCYVIMPEDTPIERNIQTLSYGANLVLVKNSTVSECIDMIEEVNENYGWVHLTTAAAVNPYHIEGTKTIAYEIAEALGWDSPNWIIVPAGGAGLSVAMWKGFKELHLAGIIKSLPRLMVVQAEGCAPIVRAFEKGETHITRWENPDTIATAIGVPFPLDGKWSLEALYESKGIALSVSDEEIIKASKFLAESEGIFAEPTGAASVAGFIKAFEKGIIRTKETIVSTITGTGLKSLKTFQKIVPKPIIIDQSANELKAFLENSKR